MFSPLDILLGAAGVLVALGVSAPLFLYRGRRVRAARPLPAPAPAPVAHELQKQAS